MMKPILWFENTRRLMFGKYEGEPVGILYQKTQIILFIV